MLMRSKEDKRTQAIIGMIGIIISGGQGPGLPSMQRRQCQLARGTNEDEENVIARPRALARRKIEAPDSSLRTISKFS